MEKFRAFKFRGLYPGGLKIGCIIFFEVDGPISWGGGGGIIGVGEGLNRNFTVY